MSRKSTLNRSSFQPFTYARIENSSGPTTGPQKIQGVTEFHLPRLTKSNNVKIAKRKRKLTQHGNFETLIFPRSTDLNNKPTATTETPSATVQDRDELLRQAENEKLELLMHARGEAIAIVAKAEKEGKKVKKEIKEKAREEGLKEAEVEIEKRLSLLDELLERLAFTQELCHQQNKDEMVKLALTCARRLINREITLDQSVIDDCVREVLSESNVQGSVTLLLNSDDLELIDKQRSQLLSDFPQIHDLKIEVGESIERGGCVLESSMGRIDASLRSKFEELNRLLLRETQ